MEIVAKWRRRRCNDKRLMDGKSINFNFLMEIYHFSSRLKWRRCNFLEVERHQNCIMEIYRMPPLTMCLCWYSSFVWWWTCCYINFFRLHISLSLFRYCCPAAYKMHLKRVKKDGECEGDAKLFIYIKCVDHFPSLCLSLFFGIIFVHARKMKIYDWQNFTNFPSKISLCRCSVA